MWLCRSGACCSPNTTLFSTEILLRGGDHASRGAISVSISSPQTTNKKQAPSLSSSSISLQSKKPKEELTKAVMGLVMWHSDTKPLLGFLRGEVTLTWQKHRTKLDLKGSSCPVTSKRQDTALSPWRAENGYVPSFNYFCQSSQIEKMSFQLKFLFNFGLLFFHPGRWTNQHQSYHKLPKS